MKKYNKGNIVFFYWIFILTIFSKLFNLPIKFYKSLDCSLKHKLIWLTFLLLNLLKSKYQAFITSFYNLLSNEISLAAFPKRFSNMLWCEDQSFYIYFIASVKILSSISLCTFVWAEYNKFKISKLDATYYIF